MIKGLWQLFHITLGAAIGVFFLNINMIINENNFVSYTIINSTVTYWIVCAALCGCMIMLMSIDEEFGKEMKNE
jgi:hypothetical protein